MTTHELIDQHKERLLGLMSEVSQAAAACGHPLDEDLPQGLLELTASWPPYKTSMLQDFESGRPLELEPILGSLLRLAEAQSLILPGIGELYRNLLPD